MSWFRRFFDWAIPEDPEPGCGYGSFKLPLNHPFTIACNLHDFDFGLSHAGEPEKTKDLTDIELFKRWSMIALGQSEDYERIRLIKDICRYWPLARTVGNLMWEGDPK